MKARYILLLGLSALTVMHSCSEYEPDSVLGDTRVKIRLESNSAKPKWESGDKVSAFAMNGSTPVASYVFTADGRGTATDFFCPTDLAETTHYRFVYPHDGNLELASDGIHATIPVSQKAVSGSISPELFLSSGSVTNLSEEVTLTPLVSLIRFTLLGGAAESVSKVTVTGSEVLSGSVVFYDKSTFHSSFVDKPLPESNPTNYITLTGHFSSGGVYYAAAVPGAKDISLQVTAEDASGRIHTVTVTDVSLTAGEVTDLGNVYLGPSLVESGELIPIMKATRGPKPIILMFVPDGFVEGAGPNSKEEYVAACREGAAYIFNVEPFKSNRDRFTVYSTWKAASEPGVGTTFGCSLGLWYDDYLGLTTAVRNDICNFAQDLCPEIKDGTIRPAELGMILIVNGRKNYGAVCEWTESDPQYEGRFVALVDFTGDYQWREGLPVGVVASQWGGTTSAGAQEARTDENGNTYTYTLTENDFRSLGYVNYSGSSWGYLNTWKNTMLHEACGHGFGRLQDEYWFSTTAYPYASIAGQNKKPRQAMNVSASMTDYPWKNLMALRDELIQRDKRYERIGMFQGGMASYFSGVWRAEWTSAMNDLRPYFSTWDRALIYERIMHLSGEAPEFDVVNSIDDLKTFLEADIATDGNFDPLRDNTSR